MSKLGDEETRETTTGLARVIENAARLGDAKGDDEEATRLLESGLERFSAAPRIERARAFLYLAELHSRVGDAPAALESLTTALAIELSNSESIRNELSGHDPRFSHCPPRQTGMFHRQARVPAQGRVSQALSTGDVRAS